MTEPQASSKKVLLILAGVGILGALVLIGLGLVLYFTAKDSPPEVAQTTSTSTATAAPPQPTATTMAGVVIIASATPTPAAEVLPAQTAETLNRNPTATRLPTNTPSPTVAVVQRWPTVVTVDGSIELIAPPDNTQAAGGIVEFKWIWHENKGCEQPPDGYAFEIRVWRDLDYAAPMGAMDAQTQKPNITCDPASGIRSLTIGRIATVPGAEGVTSGRLRWDVALVQLSPYQPIITTQYRTFFY
ncbi:MAG: hypothetical protein FOGNACKC_05735 [Anaerolineae bacterium]|nr:hypothetical protein [Anaerolineae bacterium]